MDDLYMDSEINTATDILVQFVKDDLEKYHPGAVPPPDDDLRTLCHQTVLGHYVKGRGQRFGQECFTMGLYVRMMVQEELDIAMAPITNC